MNFYGFVDRIGFTNTPDLFDLQSVSYYIFLVHFNAIVFLLLLISYYVFFSENQMYFRSFQHQLHHKWRIWQV